MTVEKIKRVSKKKTAFKPGDYVIYNPLEPEYHEDAVASVISQSGKDIVLDVWAQLPNKAFFCERIETDLDHVFCAHTRLV
jgi:hypothetical protein